MAQSPTKQHIDFPRGTLSSSPKKPGRPPFFFASLKSSPVPQEGSQAVSPPVNSFEATSITDDQLKPRRSMSGISDAAETESSSFPLPYSRVVFEGRETRGILADLSFKKRVQPSHTTELRFESFSETIHKAEIIDGFLHEGTSPFLDRNASTTISDVLGIEDIPRFFDSQVSLS